MDAVVAIVTIAAMAAVAAIAVMAGNCFVKTFASWRRSMKRQGLLWKL